MGLDGVELVLEVEESFKISIADEDASRIRTVGELFDLILTKRAEKPNESWCMTATSFRRIRNGLMSVADVPRSAIRVDAELESLLPSRRRHYWKRLGEVTKLRLPPLSRPEWLWWTAAAAVVALSVWLAWRSESLFLGALAALMTGCLLNICTEPLAIVLPPDCATVGDFSKRLLAMNFATFEATRESFDRDEAWRALVAVIVSVLGISPEKVTKEASFVNDLGLS